MRITVKTLEKYNACKGAVALFKETFPKGAEVTQANVAKALEAGLGVWWLRDASMPADVAKGTYCICKCPTGRKAGDTCCAKHFMRGIRAMEKAGRKRL